METPRLLEPSSNLRRPLLSTPKNPDLEHPAQEHSRGKTEGILSREVMERASHTHRQTEISHLAPGSSSSSSSSSSSQLRATL
ncbi:hypothetical protein NQZ68_002703 [Dissostichus eleginoides]|nr:hypothetical protein NQZ68_002703 [Dissostichus eleginoides]